MLLLDSQVICAVIAKGRSSSRRLQRSLKVLNALCLAGGLVLAIAYGDTGNNPSDIPSRWGGNVLQTKAGADDHYWDAVALFQSRFVLSDFSR